MTHDGSTHGRYERHREGRAVLITVGLLLALGVALAGSLAARSPNAAAQESALALPAVPGPELCTVEPRSIDEYSVMTGTPEPAPVAFTIPAGRPADQATIDEVIATMIEAAACINTGDLKRLDSLYTDAFFNGEVNQRYYDFLAAENEPVPVEDRYAIFAVALVQTLSDGRIAAIVQFQDDGIGGADLMIFAQEDGRYLIDKWVDGPFDIDPDFAAFEEEAATPEAATPAL